jgi:peptidoglycan/LPS O-acetylase OafA/YrhL
MSTQAPSAVPAAVAPPPGNPRFPLFDSLRAIAALAVLLFHVALLSGVDPDSWYGRPLAHLNVGVTIFFLISGFLLYRPFVAARVLGTPPVRLRAYARRRALRILPAYWLALTLLAVWPGLPGMFDADWPIYYGLLQTLPFLYDPAPCLAIGGCGLPQAWSLSAEVTFYVALPLLAAGLAAFRRRGGARRELAGIAALALASLAFLGYAVTTYPEHPRLYEAHLGLAGTLLWFGLGMALAVLSVAAQAADRTTRAESLVTRRPLLAWAGAAVLFGAATALPSEAVQTASEAAVHLLRHLLYGLSAALLLLPAVFGFEAGGLPRRILANRALAWLGLISYGIFLWHYSLAAELDELPFLLLVPVTLALSTGVAALSYYVLERPLLRLKHPA